MRKIVFYPILVFFAVTAFPQDQSSNQESEADLIKILKNTREYCRKLEGAALNYVCLEEISERSVRYMQSFQFRMSIRREEVRHKYLYDYQYIRKDGRLDAKRILLEQDGLKMRKKRQTQLLTRHFHYENVLFGPVNLLCEERQYFFNYKIIGKKLIDKEKAIVLEATPKPWVSENVFGGTIWLSESDYSILKIEWDQNMLIRTDIIKEMSKRYKGDPVIIQTIEFGFEKNGIRFPSKFSIREAYVNKKGKKTNVFYRDYKFFTVETNVKYDSVEIFLESG
ncbi:hypothetical protein ACFLT9_14725 [Acidobacteriota bacterium]